MEKATKVYNVSEVIESTYQDEELVYEHINDKWENKRYLKMIGHGEYRTLCWCENANQLESEFPLKINNKSMELEFIDVTPIQLSEDEKVILRNLPGDFKWITRDEDGALFLNKEEPIKRRDCWNYQQEQLDLAIFDHLFQRVQWSDKEPTLIADLL